MNNEEKEFLKQAQKPKMTELWDNPEDEEWENVFKKNKKKTK